ncbi:hypothetical protein ACWCQN_41500 [Streptomyces sp. NPDC001984]|uniref:hypothetical protein n=1 Tax=Streptomyces sp. NPDC002619 TaxID=3364655 RepID=UPI00369ACF26
MRTPGHTKGRCAYHPLGSGILVSGDALETPHPTSGITGPRLLLDMFHTDRARALDALAVLHGPLHRGSAQQAATTARERAGS